MKRYRDAETGEFVTEEYALAHPGTTVSEEMMTDEEREARTELLKAKLAASLGQPGYADRVAAIEAELERLRAS
jgi:hypothetical protein